ncbi:MAG: hypothetical protein JSV96_09195 [Candidatus Aminicenantes bacterium]|nr:MAG: hypothetical protein JSV96_09195 [Candidatus Aminicenantes bacterium]
MKKIILALILMVALLGIGIPATAQEEDEEIKGKNYFLNLSLFYPVSLNKTKEDSTNINLSLIYSRVGYISGVDLSLVGSAVSHRLRGIQICGLVGVIGSHGTGLQASGLFNVAGKSFTGFQGSGLMNIVGSDFTGLQTTFLMNIVGSNGAGLQTAGLANIAGENYSWGQIAGGFNIVGDRAEGFQIAGGFNIAGDRAEGFQLGGLFNIVGERFSGFQMAGLCNVVGDVFEGLQLGTFNIAGESKGVQIGVANAGETSEGVQIGVVNYTKKENTGVPFGLVNLAKNGRIRGVFWGGNQVAATAGMKFTVGRLYSIVSVGGGNLDDSISGSLTYGFHYGISFPVGQTGLYTDLGFRFRDNEPLFKHLPLERDQYILEARFIWGIPISKEFSFLLGTGVSRRWNTGEGFPGKNSLLILAGIEIF